MLKGTAARRHADAVFSLALEGEQASGSDKPGLDRWQEDLNLIASVLQDVEIGAFLASPRVSTRVKRETLARALAGRVSELALNLTFLLVERDGTQMIPAIARRFGELLNQHRGVQEATVTTAVALSEDQQTAVIARLEQMTGKTIVLRQRIDPAILGGVVVRVGDTLIDDSLAHRLEEMRAALASARRSR